MFPNILFPGVENSRSPTGSVSMDGDTIAALNKALTAGYGTDTSLLTGGSAFRIQSLDKTMYATIQENKHFRLINALPKTNAGATVDEWTEQSGVGGFLGGSTNTEDGQIRMETGTYNRRTAQVKYLMTRRQVSFVATLGNNIVEAEAIEAQAGAIKLLTDAEFLSFEGDSSVVPTEFDGIDKQLRDGVAGGQVDSGNIIDARAASLNSVNLLNQSAAQIARLGNFGIPTHIFTSLGVQQDFDTGLDPAFRVPLTDVPGGGIQIGAPVVGIRTSHGNIATCPDVFVRDQDQLVPFQLIQSALATANTGMKPTVSPAATSDAASLFNTGQDGNYYYAVAGLNGNGQSDVVISSQVAVAVGDKVTLTITASGGNAETGYAVYRGRKNGTNAVTDFRLIGRIAKAGATTPFVDLNRDIPGTVKAFVLNLSPGYGAMSWRQLLPMMKFPLYATDSPIVPWAQLLFGYLRMTKRRQHVVIKNILPTGATWRPFG